MRAQRFLGFNDYRDCECKLESWWEMDQAEAILCLEADGIPVRRSHHDPAGAILLAEAVNNAAKVIDESYYDLKVGCVVAAARLPGVTVDLSDQGLVRLDAPGLDASRGFHGWFINELVSRELPPTTKFAVLEWDGISRQHMAFDFVSKRLELTWMMK